MAPCAFLCLYSRPSAVRIVRIVLCESCEPIATRAFWYSMLGMYTDRIGSSDFSDRIGLDPIRSDDPKFRMIFMYSLMYIIS